MSAREPRAGRSAPRLLPWLAALLLLGLYVGLPDGNDASNARAPRAGQGANDASDDEGERLEILDVTPHDPYPGGTIAVSHSPTRAPLEVFAA
ncbi:MAG TPA: hypothetical protein VFZ61_32725, partial [Polyangiales bacterium]